ncbi:MAG: sigma-70 family RNA polymerase sigma factor [Planctomycetes bacterium]|nr:sigma-70 family RNA polymerase sigma factor [Planctomycetota bacterium]
MRLFLAHQRRIYGFILAMLPNAADADDVLQETNLVMWDAFDRFEPGTDFAAWGMQIARFRILRYFEQRKRERRTFSQKTMEMLADEMAGMGNAPDAIHGILGECVDKLPAEERQLITMRYEQDAAVKDVADRMGLSIFTIYKRLNQTYLKLLNCIRRTMNPNREGAL